jgi:hypothetical protein
MHRIAMRVKRNPTAALRLEPQTQESQDPHQDPER